MKMNEIVKTKKHYPNYKGTTTIIDTIINFRHNKKAVTLSGRKEVRLLSDNILSLILSVVASVIAYYICKWLDR